MTTIQSFLQEFLPGVSETCPSWPPDVFGLCIALLNRTGAYRLVVSEWKPGPTGGEKWADAIARVAANWREEPVGGLAPERVHRLWTRVWQARKQPIDEIVQRRELWKALLELSSLADQASGNAGIPLGERAEGDAFHFEAASLLARDVATLGKQLDPSRVRVLPKLHTPQTGLTIRSLSHHLCAYRPGDLEVAWHNVPTGRLLHSLNLLLLPWPTEISPSQFSEAEQAVVQLDARFGFFRFASAPPSRAASRIKGLIERAQAHVGRIDGVVLPELALPQRTYVRVRRAVLDKACFLVAGVQEPESSANEMGGNTVHVDIPAASGYQSTTQDKHHRWRVQRSQIVQYGLGSVLNPQRSWWEWMPIHQRRLGFFAMRPWLTMCALICEDLAQQEPVGEVVRAVGPNLVLALLMDGPQLRERWAGRYATVLADDPGSSVLTLTSLGMSMLSRPAGKEPSRTVGLWKDAKSGDAIPLNLPSGAEALVLSLAVDYCEEWTADGRSDNGATGYPTFAGVHAI